RAKALEIRLIGNCKYVKGRLTADIAESLGLSSSVRVIDPVPYKRALEYTMTSHLLVLLAPDQPYEIPGKAYEYLASGVSILALTQDGATADLIRNTGGGDVVDPKDIGGIKRAVFGRYVTWAAHRSCYPRRPPAEALAMYHAAGLEVSWLDLDTFDFATLGRLMRIIREHRIELVHWNIYRPVNLYLCALSVVAPALRHYLTDHITRELPMELPRGG